LQGDVNLQNKIAADLHRGFEDASPFLLPLRSVWPMLFSEHTEQEVPLLLIAPFWDETQANVANDAGGVWQERASRASSTALVETRRLVSHVVSRLIARGMSTSRIRATTRFGISQ
jgi:hypothetical protein